MTPLQPLVHDCDPGIDDAVALLLALHSPELSLRAVTTTHGNVALNDTTSNGLELLAFAGRPEVPLYAGAAAPLVRAPVYAPEIHGRGGLGSVTLPETAKQPEALHAALALSQLSREFSGELTVCATGPVTNLALAERLDPGCLARLKEVVIMGGSLDVNAPKLGNVTPYAEFNTYADPHALRVVLESGARVVLFGLNLTRQVRVTRERVAALHALGTPTAALCADMLADYLNRIEVRDQRVGALHDPCTVAYLLRPELFTLEAARVHVNIDDGERSGMTTLEDGAPNVQLATRADEDGVYALLHERLR
ncbi:nucleoside hydrolase [Deinococcus sp. KNUC1210]|uniref:nucleoside hydrolase n=1 Tax=Deinococcus sp. KNUC1210 TaxID=2917691 RepID=UPI001EF14F0A|nr:nucleoside hydrolase [Deinococcus sp. KNUC1210]ULH15267.1 nucleoside hydrolase [Deinococcus sp. KNUC1210]